MVSVLPKGDGLIDPNVKIPAAVLRHSRIADDLHQSAYAPPVDPNNPVAPLGAEPPADPNAPPAPAPAEPPQPILEVPLTPPPTDIETLQRENAGLRGGIAAMRGRLSAAGHENSTLKTRITELERAPPPPATPPRDPATNPASLITPEQRAEYGDELLDVAARAAAERLSPELEAMRQELKTIKGQNQRTAEQQFSDARNNLITQLNTDIPNWEQLNTDDRFLDWLDLRDQFSGVRRGDLLKAAYDGNDVPRVLAFFKGFLTEAAAVAPPAPAQPAAPAARIDLASLATPGKGKSAPGSVPDSKPTYTQAQIASFYADSNAGRYRGKEGEKERIEADIFAAQREGRIR